MRESLPFRAVNRCGCAGYDPALQRHHLVPHQALHITGLRRMFDSLGAKALGYHDFRRNGLLLPATSAAASRIGLPLHRGPHRFYNEMVIERLGAIEADWSASRPITRCLRGPEAVTRIALLQRALKRRLLDARKPLRLNRHDPIGKDKDFTMLDAMAERLWIETGDQAVA